MRDDEGMRGEEQRGSQAPNRVHGQRTVVGTLARGE
jgi:hypothetical protein